MRAVNLIPSEDRRGGGVGVGAGRSEGAAYAVLGVLAVLAMLALLYGIARHQVSSKRSQLASVQARTQSAHEAAAGLASYTSFLSLREQRVTAVTDLVDSRFDWAQSFHELGRVLPRDTTITSLNGTIGSDTGSSSTGSASAPSGGSVSSATPPGSVPSVTLDGCASSQAAVALTLQRLRLIEGVSNVALQSSSKSSTSSAASGQCPSGHPSFTVLLTFAPLPAVSASAKSSTQLTSSTGGGQ
jgi:type II secretory pathway pseudopilin PulG